MGHLQLPKIEFDSPLVARHATMGHLQLSNVEVDSALVARHATKGHWQLPKVEVNSSSMPCKVDSTMREKNYKK